MEKSLEKIKNEVSGLAGDTNAYIRSLARSHPLRQEILLSAIRYLDLPPKSAGIDVGCGIGLPALLLAGAGGKDLHVTGVDISKKFIQTAGNLAAETGLSDRLCFEQGSASDLPFGESSFDWAWSVDCVNYAPAPPIGQLHELKRVVKKGGKIALLGWSSQLLLPGFPALEAKLNATKEGIAPFKEGMEPARHFLKTGKLLNELGFQGIGVKTFIKDIRAPLEPDIFSAVKDLIKMRWPETPSALSEDELALYRQITDPDSPGFILADANYYGFFTYTMFFATKE
ncbi:MAG: class I SAM-dependent methyltransferase [Desulfobacteraceae bacterium]|nr:class I SAM-dependent methyltransferase [Desulfobacteraceae bacterium]